MIRVLILAVFVFASFDAHALRTAGEVFKARTANRPVSPDRHTVEVKDGKVTITDKYTGQGVPTTVERSLTPLEVAQVALGLCRGNLAVSALCTAGAVALPCIVSSITQGKWTCSNDGGPVTGGSTGTVRTAPLCNSPSPAGGYSIPGLGATRQCSGSSLCAYVYGGAWNSSANTCTVNGTAHARVTHGAGDYGYNCSDGSVRTTCPANTSERDDAQALSTTAAWAAATADRAGNVLPDGNQAFTSADWISDSIKGGQGAAWGNTGTATAVIPNAIPLGYGTYTQISGGTVTTVPFQDWAVVPPNRSEIQLDELGRLQLDPQTQPAPRYGAAGTTSDPNYEIFQWTPQGWRNSAGQAATAPFDLSRWNEQEVRDSVNQSRPGQTVRFVSPTTGAVVTVNPDGSIDYQDGINPGPGTGTGTQPPVIFPDYCIDNPDRVGCARLGTPTDSAFPEPISKSVLLDIVPLGLPAACPHPVPLPGNLPPLSFEPICDVVYHYVRPVVVAGASFFAILLVVGFVRQS